MNLVLESLHIKAKRQLDEIFEHGTPFAVESVLLFIRMHALLHKLKPNAETRDRMRINEHFCSEHLRLALKQWEEQT